MSGAQAAGEAPQQRAAGVVSLLIGAAAGACTVFAFAPFGVSGLAFATFTVLFWQWQRATSAREAAPT